MNVSDFDYFLPHELIAQRPLADRTMSRMLVVERASGSISDSQFSEFPDFLRDGDVLVINDTKVFPARLIGRSETGAKIEIFLVRQVQGRLWEALSRPAKRLPPGRKIFFGDELNGQIVEREGNGKVMISLEAESDLDAVLDRIGRTPLPPYIRRDNQSPDTDRDRYQTVFARASGSIAAPTAGLHFTDGILKTIKDKGVDIVSITLHVGYGTFEPVRVDDIAVHRVSPERYEINESSAALLNSAIKDHRRIIAVGTTTTRALEDSMARNDEVTPGRSQADLTIIPGYRFKAVSGLFTNFHLPKSSLLILVSAFGGRELIMKAYQHAVASEYRFYSYGDCMLLI